MDDVAAFLARFPPFDELDGEELSRVVAGAREREYAAGEVALVEDGEPASSLYVIRSGSMELVHQGEAVDRLEPGESFGQVSVLTGLAPAFTVRARERSSCLLIGADAALRALGRPTGVGYLAGTLRERLVRTGHTVHALPELRTAHVGALVERPAVFCSPDDPIRAAARAMTAEDVTAVLVQGERGLGIVTDADIRERVVAGEVSPDDPLAAIVRAPVRSVPADHLVAEAMIDLLGDGAHELCVVGPGGEVLGVLSAEGLLRREWTAFDLLRRIARAADEDELVEAAGRLPAIFALLLDAGLEPAGVGRVLAHQSDAITARLIELSIARHGPAPLPWAWMALGSVARRELTLASDQDNALAYADSDDEAGADAYFARLGADVNRGLARCGFGADAAEVVARDRRWRMPRARWQAVFRECLEQPDRSHLVRAAVAFDFRHVVGGLEIVAPLVELIRDAHHHPDFIRRLARTATDHRSPLGLRGKIVGERAPGGGRWLDLKRTAVLPIANIARLHALSAGITISSTLDRLTAAEGTGALEPETAEALRDAFRVIWRIRLEHQAARAHRDLAPDNTIELDSLAPLTRLELREALRAVAGAQKRLSYYAPLGL